MTSTLRAHKLSQNLSKTTQKVANYITSGNNEFGFTIKLIISSLKEIQYF